MAGVNVGALAGQIEGIVGSLGLFYTSLVSGADRIMIPDDAILNLAVIPLREPDRIELRARLEADTTPTEVEQRLADGGRLAGEVLSAVRETEGDQRHGDGAQRRDA